jgi:TRAP-type mannitol/chloroaromatic compound transport system permease small subunit
MDRPGLHSGPSLERIPLPVVLVDTTKVPGHLLFFIFYLLFIFHIFFIFPNPDVSWTSGHLCTQTGGVPVHQEAQWRLEKVLVCTFDPPPHPHF